METSFTPLASFAGGVLIGLAALLMMAANGRIAGVSGIVSRLLPPSPEPSQWATGFAFVVGLLLATPFVLLATGSIPETTVPTNFTLLIVTGLLVGFGSVMGNGCTSGHGVCGISRLSARSIIATLVFMGAAALAVFVMRHGS